MWPPLMPPFFLPLIGSAAGDWLVLRLKGPPCRSEAVSAASDATTAEEASWHQVTDGAPLPVVATDICQWYHGGGDWLPWGNTLPEALLFDGLLPQLPGAGQRHAEPAETPDDPSCDRSDAWLSHRWGQWASGRLGGRCVAEKGGSEPVAGLLAMQGEALVQRLCQLGWCEVAARCQAIIHELGSRVGRTVEPSMAARLGVSWNELMRWCFDLREMPEDVAAKIVAWSEPPSEESASDEADSPPADDRLLQRVRAEQDWEAIEHHAAAVSRLAPELAWGHELLGHVKFRAGEYEAGRRHFSHALRCSVFTDQSVRLRTHWATSGAGRPAKFAAFFLDSPGGNLDSTSGNHDSTGGSEPEQSAEVLVPAKARLEDFPVNAVSPSDFDSLHRLPDSWPLTQYVDLLHRGDSSAVRRSVTEWFSDLAEQAVASRRNEEAIVALIAAGWDLGAEPMNAYVSLVDRLLHACQAADWQPHAALMQAYRQCFQSRYGL